MDLLSLKRKKTSRWFGFWFSCRCWIPSSIRVSTLQNVARRVFRSAKKRKKKASNGSSTVLDLDSDSWRPTSHFVEYGVVVDSKGNVVDEVLAVPMLSPRLYTREDVVELQCHGSEVCLRRVLRTCVEAGVRLT